VFAVAFGNALLGLCIVLGAGAAGFLGALLAHRIPPTPADG
jgi:hypothetical protein